MPGYFHMDIAENKLNKVKADAKGFYQGLDAIRCPYFQEDVRFNSEVFEHLLFKSWNRTRSAREQYIRLRLLKLVPEVVSATRTLQEYSERHMMIRQRINSRWEKRRKLVRYYAFVAIVGAAKDCRIKVIIKEIEGGSKMFWSLYPSWKVVADD